MEDSSSPDQKVCASAQMHQQRVETTSTQDSTLDVHFSDGMSPTEGENAIWSVTMPSEVVLHCDILANHSFERFGKVLSVADLNE